MYHGITNSSICQHRSLSPNYNLRHHEHSRWRCPTIPNRTYTLSLLASWDLHDWDKMRWLKWCTHVKKKKKRTQRGNGKKENVQQTMKMTQCRWDKEREVAWQQPMLLTGPQRLGAVGVLAWTGGTSSPLGAGGSAGPTMPNKLAQRLHQGTLGFSMLSTRLELELQSFNLGISLGWKERFSKQCCSHFCFLQYLTTFNIGSSLSPLVYNYCSLLIISSYKKHHKKQRVNQMLKSSLLNF